MKRIAPLLLTSLVLTSCAWDASSSSSSSRSSSSKEEFPPGRRIDASGSLTYRTTFHVSGEDTLVFGHVDGLKFDASINALPTVLSDLFDPVFYEDMKMVGVFSFDELSFSTTQGKITQTTSIAKSKVDMAMSQGDFYLDSSDLEPPSYLSFISDYIPSKIRMIKPFASIGEYDPGIPLPLTDLPSLLLGAVDFAALEPYLGILPYDRDTLKISFAVNKDSLQAVVDLYTGEDAKPIDWDAFLPSLEDSSIAIYYNLSQERVSQLDLVFGADFDIGKYVAQLSSLVDPVHLRFDLKIPIYGVEKVIIPTLEGYQDWNLEPLAELIRRIVEALYPEEAQTSSGGN